MAKAAAKYKEKVFSSGILVNFVLCKILQVAFSKLLTFIINALLFYKSTKKFFFFLFFFFNFCKIASSKILVDLVMTQRPMQSTNFQSCQVDYGVNTTW